MQATSGPTIRSDLRELSDPTQLCAWSTGSFIHGRRDSDAERGRPILLA